MASRKADECQGRQKAEEAAASSRVWETLLPVETRSVASGPQGITALPDPSPASLCKNLCAPNKTGVAQRQRTHGNVALPSKKKKIDLF